MTRNTDSESAHTQQGRSKEQRSDLAAEVRWESEKRRQLGVPAVAAGVLYLLSGIIINATLNGAPTVGLLQAISPALKGIASPSESPRAAEVRFISHHAFALIAGSALSTLSLLALAGMLYLLARAARFRRPESWAAAGPLAIIGGIGFGIIGIAHQIGSAVLAHNFATGGVFTNAAVERTLTTGPVNIAAQYISLIVGLALVVGMIAVCLGAMRVGLLTRWMGIVGILSAVLIFLPIGGATLELIPAFWMAALGILYMGRWPNGDPPAWASGQARPWPSQAEMRAQQQAQAAANREARRQSSKRPEPAQAAASNGSGSGNGADLPSRPAEPVDAGVPAPVPIRAGNAQAGKRRRKRSSRR